METETLKPYLVVIGLLAATSLALAFTVNVHVTDQAGILMDLPERVGAWYGDELTFCQNPVCQREYRLGALAGRTNCPACGGKLGPMTQGENHLLPPDTDVLKQVYTNAAGDILFVSIVLSGREGTSIHRPQVCLHAQGNEITRSFRLDVPLEGRRPLGVMMLDLLQELPQPDGKRARKPTFYAYWFVGKHRETPYHVQRMIWMASDRIFRNVSHRWAYVAVSGARKEGSEAHVQQVREFVRELYPRMVLRDEG